MHDVDHWAEIPIGTLVDEDIAQLARNGKLIVEGFNEGSLKQACYELRTSDTFWDVTSQPESQRLILPDGYVLGPKESVVAIVKEVVELPDDVLGRILTKGQLFALGILPVNTYADPGFEGRLGITLWNASNRYLVLKPDSPIAKIEFVRLPKPVARPYNGQHGYAMEIWPISPHYFADSTNVEVRKRLRDIPTELDRSYGKAVGDLARDLRWYAAKVWLQLSVVIGLFAVIFALHGKLSLFYSLLLGVGANLASAFLYPRIADAGRRVTGRR